MKIEIKSPPLTPGLYLVATPIGNLGDITLRALEVLGSADLIYCEDTRQTQKLLNAYDIRTKTAAYHDHSTDSIRKKILNQIVEEGKVIALVSDAGMPLISDPGYKLIQQAKETDVYVTTLPGANAVLSAIQLSGLPSEPFLFLGFLPPKKQAMQNELKRWQDSSATLVFYEAKQRVLKTLREIKDLYGDRQVAVIRELTKKFEEVLRGTAGELLKILEERSEIKGEFVIVLAPFKAQAFSEEKVESLIKEALAEHVPVKKIAEDVAGISGWSKKDIYNLAVKLKAS